ncbi:MAG: hypothetical protein ABEL51_07765 [Salinibacter sp.]
MSQLEYLVALISIIVGLGLADLVQSLRELVRPDRAVRWHWLPLLWAAVIFLIILQLWWTSFDVLQAEPFGRVLVFLPYLLMFLVLYLTCSFALPDANWESSPSASEKTTLDLKVFYFSLARRRWFFGALITLTVLSQIINISAPALVDKASSSVTGRLPTVGFNVLIAALLYGLIASDREWLHALVALLVFGAVVFSLAIKMSPIG